MEHLFQKYTQQIAKIQREATANKAIGWRMKKQTTKNNEMTNRKRKMTYYSTAEWWMALRAYVIMFKIWEFNFHMKCI